MTTADADQMLADQRLDLARRKIIDHIDNRFDLRSKSIANLTETLSKDLASLTEPLERLDRLVKCCIVTDCTLILGILVIFVVK